MPHKLMMLLLLFTMLSFSTAKAAVHSVAKGDAMPAGQHFVTASLLTITPGRNVYSALGHTALRMECPSKKLDLCFTFETEAGLMGYLSFFAGQSRAAFVPVPTNEFLDGYSREGRGVSQYELNLTPHEKQELWRALDDDMLQGAHRKFNMLQNNCATMLMLKIEEVLAQDSAYIDFVHMPAQMSYHNAQGIEWLSRRAPCAQFLFMTFVGSEADEDWPLENKIAPELIVPVLRGAHIRKSTEASAMPVLTGRHMQLLPQTRIYKASAVTPTVAFSALLVIAVSAALACVLRICRGCGLGRVAKTVGWVAAVAYFLASAFLLYVTVVAGLFGVHWNWLLIPFNVLPFFVWLVMRRRHGYHNVYWAYVAVLALFCAATPWLTNQLLPAHYLIVITIAVLCSCRALRPSYNHINQKNR